MGDRHPDIRGKTGRRAAFTAIVLAADREADNPVAGAAGVACKALAPVGGVPMVIGVLEALAASEWVGERILCGPPRAVLEAEPVLRRLVDSGAVRWHANRPTPSESAHAVMVTLPPERAVLLTTGDHALLGAPVVDDFCRRALASGRDLAVGLAPREAVSGAYPDSRRTAYRLADGAYCSCNLFAFMTPRSRAAADFWRHVERHRKNPLRVINAFGWGLLLRYLAGRLSLSEGLERISRRLGCAAGAVVLPFPEAAVDVDSVSDWHIARRAARRRGS